MQSPCYSTFKPTKSSEEYKWKPSGMNSPFHVYDDFYFKREIKEAGMPFNYATDPNRFLPLTDCVQYPPGSGQRGPIVKGATPMNVVDLNSEIRNQFRKTSKCPSQKYFPTQVSSNRINSIAGKPLSRGTVNFAPEGFNGGAPYLGDKMSNYGANFVNTGPLGVNNLDCEKCNHGLPCNSPRCEYGMSQKFGGPGMNPVENLNMPQFLDCDVPGLIPEQSRQFGKACNLPGVFINRFEALCDDLQDPKTIDSNQKIGVDTRNIIKDAYSMPNLKKMSGRLTMKKMKPQRK